MPARVEADFGRETEPYRRELLAHCYRMLGSAHEAEDLVQETYLRAWRGYSKFEDRSSMRTWLYRIATNACLTAIDQRGRRPLPTGLGGPQEDATAELTTAENVPWLEPAPSTWLGSDPDDPASVAASKESTRLAFVAALQHLPAKQRVVLLLREVLAWKASEVAELLETSTAAVNSALQRARAQLDEVKVSEDDITDLEDPELRKTLERYVEAFEQKDMKLLEEVMKDDIVWEMPPFLSWFVGRDQVAKLNEVHCPPGPNDARLLPAYANGQLAFGMYARGSTLEEGGSTTDFVPFQLQVLSFEGGLVSRVVAFFDTTLFAKFGLPDVVRD